MQSIQTLTKMSSVLEASAIPTKGAAKGDSGIIGFHYPNSDEVVDKICSAGFLGNYYDVGHAGIEIEAPIERGRRRPFRNAEAAFQALKFWSVADKFSDLMADKVEDMKQLYRTEQKLNYAGFGTPWKAMLAV